MNRKILLLGLVGLLQNVAGAPSNEETNPPIQLAAPTALEWNMALLQPLNTMFGNIGPILNVLLTDPNALGKEISQVTAIVKDRIGEEKQQEAMQVTFDILRKFNFSDTLIKLFNEVEDIRDDTTNETFGEAVIILKNILTNDETAELILKRIKEPSMQQD